MEYAVRNTLLRFVGLILLFLTSCDREERACHCAGGDLSGKSLMPCRDSTKSWFYIDAQGNAVTGAVFDRISYFLDGHGVACKGDSCYILNHFGQVLLDFNMGDANSISFNGRYVFMHFNGEDFQQGVKTIDVLAKHIADSILPWSFLPKVHLSKNFFVSERDSILLIETGTWQKKLSLAKSENVSSISLRENYLTIEYSYPKYGFKHYSPSGEKIFSSDCGQSQGFSDGLACIEDCEGKFFYIDTLGVIALSNSQLPKFDRFRSFSYGHAVVLKFLPDSFSSPIQESYREFNFINKQGKLICADGFQRAEDFYGGLAAVYRDGLWGFIDCHCSLVLPFKYTDVFHHGFKWGNCWVETNGHWVLINRNGEVQYSCESCGFNPGIVTSIEMPHHN